MQLCDFADFSEHVFMFWNKCIFYAKKSPWHILFITKSPYIVVLDHYWALCSSRFFEDVGSIPALGNISCFLLGVILLHIYIARIKKCWNVLIKHVKLVDNISLNLERMSFKLVSPKAVTEEKSYVLSKSFFQPFGFVYILTF